MFKDQGLMDWIVAIGVGLLAGVMMVWGFGWF